jgi:hypothetical protein
MMKSADQFETVIRILEECTRHIPEVLIFTTKTYKSPDSSLGIASGYEAGWPRERSSSPGRGKSFLLSTASRPVLGHTHPPIQWVWVGGKRIN